EEKHVPNTVSASARKKSITVLQPHVITKKDVNSDLNGLSSRGVDNTKTRRPQPRSNTKNDRVPSASKSSRSQNKEAEVEEHHRNLLLYKNNKHISSACNNIKIDSRDVISKVVCAMCQKCLISVNHDKCLSNPVNGKNSCGKNQKAKVSVKEIQKKYQPKITKPKKLGTRESLATPKPRKSRLLLRWSPTGKMFDKDGKIVIQICLWCVDSGCSKHMTGNLKLLINFVCKFMGTVRFENDHVAAIMGFSDLQWGNILITRVYFVEGLGHNLFSVGQFYDSDLEVAFRRNAFFVRNLEGVDLLKGDRSINLYTINLHEMASASPICLMARASSTKKPNILFFHVFGALCYPKNDREDIGKLDAKGDIGFFIGYSADSCAYRVYNSRTKKIMETMNVSFDELSAMAFEQRSSKPGLNSMTFGHISSGLDLTYAPSTITTQQPSKVELDLLFEAMYDDYIGGQPSATARTVPPAQEPQVCQSSMASTTIADNVPIPTNSSSLADYPLEQVIGEPSRPVLTRNQLRSDSDMCMYALSVSTMEPKNVKEAMTNPAWIDSMQEELIQFKRLDLFSDLMKGHFEMSMIGEMTFFLRLQVNQSPCGIFINQSKYVLEILNKYGMESSDPVGTPMEIKDKLDLDQNGTPVDATKYRSMIGALMYLTSSRPGIIHATCLCARYQAKTTEKHLKEVKRIFRYLWGTVNTGLWYTKDSGFELTGFSDVDYAGCKDSFKSSSILSSKPGLNSMTSGHISSGFDLTYAPSTITMQQPSEDADYAGCKDTFKSTSGEAQFLREKLVSWSSKKQDCMALSIAKA
nr:hypothetical protein [Tanacetum cinerariifolium]